MKNSLTEQATRVLHTVDSNLEKQVKRMIVVNALNEKNLDALHKLLTLVENSRSFSVRKKILRKGMVRDLVRLAMYTYDKMSVRIESGVTETPEIHRGIFADLCRNNYSVLQYFGLMIPGREAGTWKITKQGVLFLTDKNAVPEYFLCYGGSFRKNYAFDGHAKEVILSNFLKDSYLRQTYSNAKLKISTLGSRKYYTLLPDGNKLPTKR